MEDPWEWERDPHSSVLDAVPLARWQGISNRQSNLKTDHIPKDKAQELHSLLYSNQGVRALEIEKCRRSSWWFFTHWLWTFDKMDPQRPIKRFPQYDYLKELTLAHDERRLGKETDKPHILVVKPRAILFSTWLAAKNLHALLFQPFFQGYMMSIKLSRVDDGGKKSTPNSLFGKIRLMHRMLPDWMRERFLLEFSLGSIKNLQTMASLRAEVAGTDTGVGLQVDQGDIDEAAIVPNLEEILAVAEPGCPTGLTVGGTPRGAGTAFHRKVEDSPHKTTYRKFEIDWWMVPNRRVCLKCGSTEYAENGAELRDPDTGEVYHVMIDHTGTDCRPQDGAYFDSSDGRWTSPWFKKATSNMSEDLKRREFERDFFRAVEGKVYKMLRRREHVVEHEEWRSSGKERCEFWDHGISDNTAILHAEFDGQRIWNLEYFEQSGETYEYYCR
ncbi:hypothetical protein ACFLU6_16375, partial [Acidobacteriota bacterium]